MTLPPRILAASLLASTLLPGAEPPPTWSEEFDATGAPDPAIWDFEVGLLRNREAQFYTRARPENARVEGGNLVITARKEAWSEGGKEAAYTSASLITRGRQEFTYGRFEIRAKVPAGRGVWPAIWLLGIDKDLSWPAKGEIDMMEYVGHDPDGLHFTIHTTAFNHVKGTQKGARVQVPAAADAWHVYGLDWQPDKLVLSLDGKPVFTFANDGAGNDTWPFNRPMYLLLNLAIGGSWGGQKGIDDAIFPRELLIDYVRYWKR